jgi:hypothetical protein
MSIIDKDDPMCDAFEACVICKADFLAAKAIDLLLGVTLDNSITLHEPRIAKVRFLGKVYGF